MSTYTLVITTLMIPCRNNSSLIAADVSDLRPQAGKNLHWEDNQFAYRLHDSFFAF